MEIRIGKFKNSQTYKKFEKKLGTKSPKPLETVIHKTLQGAKIELYRTYNMYFWSVNFNKIYNDERATRLIKNTIAEFLTEEFDGLKESTLNELGQNFDNYTGNNTKLVKKTAELALLPIAEARVVDFIGYVFSSNNNSTGAQKSENSAYDNEIAALLYCDYDKHTLTISFEHAKTEIIETEITK